MEENYFKNINTPKVVPTSGSTQLDLDFDKNVNTPVDPESIHIIEGVTEEPKVESIKNETIQLSKEELDDLYSGNDNAEPYIIMAENKRNIIEEKIKRANQ